MNQLKRLLVNIMRGVHLGDAFGVPFEMMTRADIHRLVGPAGVLGPRFDLDPKLRRVPDTRGLANGSTSDDSQLANAIAEALILGDGYVHEVQVLCHLYALWNDVAGWGGTTKLSLYEIDKWYRARADVIIKPPDFKHSLKNASLWASAIERDPAEPARWREKSRGNGVAMKIAPYAAFLAARGGLPFENGEALARILELGRMTHADPICAIAAYAVASVIYDLARGISAEYAYLNLRKRVTSSERALAGMHVGEDRFSSALQTAISLTSDPEALWSFGSTGNSDSLTSVPMALTIWYRHCEDSEPTAAVLEAINAGGDTDTVASMVGAMMGASSDEDDWWPSMWVSALLDRGAAAEDLGSRLHDVAVRRSSRHPDWDRHALLARIGYL